MEIITDAAKLRQISETVSLKEVKKIIQAITDSWPENAIGLAAPQLGLFYRVFVADLKMGKIAFINPEIKFLSPDKVPSIERCLSLPNITRCVDRHHNIKIDGKFFDTNSNKYIDEKILSFKGIDAIVVQHEYDHLLGKLIIDLPETLTREERLNKKRLKRRVKN